MFGATAVLSALLVVQSLRTRAAASGRPSEYRRVVGTFLAFALYVGVMPALGYRLATLLFVLGLQVLLEPPRHGRQWARVAAVAVATTAATYLIFERYLSVLLPRGRLTGF